MKNKVSARFFMQLFISVFFIVSAVIFLSSYNSSGSQFLRGVGKLFGSTSYVGLIIAIIQLIAGAVLFLGLFINIQGRAMFFASLMIMLLWGINIVMLFFLDGFLQPSFLPWLKELSMQLIILSGLWGTIQE